MKFTKCDVIKVHTGQKFYLGDVEFETLFSPEDIFPNTIKTENDASLVFMVTIDGVKYLMTGDIEGPATELLIEQCGDYLKCDYIQIMHHGWDGGTTTTTAERALTNEQYEALYAIAKPDYLLWTAELGFVSTTAREEKYKQLANTTPMKYVIATYGSSKILTTLDGHIDLTAKR